jgi:hypothetical protein
MWPETIQSEASKIERLLRRVEAANYIREKYNIPCAPKTLGKLACIGGGPAFRKAGRFPLYPISGLDAWAQSKIGPLVRSTSEAPAKLVAAGKATKERVKNSDRNSFVVRRAVQQ